MSTDVFTLRQFSDALEYMADTWEGDQPVVLIGDVTGSVSASAKDGYTTFGPVGFAGDCFDGTGVLELGSCSDKRFFGTILMDREDIDPGTLEQIESEEQDDEVDR